MNENLVSIIIPSYINLEYIYETIDSTINQDYDNIEIIIADDGTPNINMRIYEEYINQKKKENIKNIITYTNDRNLGIVKNINKAISISNGSYIKIIAADDKFYSNDVIKKMINYMNSINSNILTTNILWCDEKMNILTRSNRVLKQLRKDLPKGKNPKQFYRMLSKRSVIPAPGVIFKKDLFDKYGLFDEEYILIEDAPMWLKLSRNGCIIDYLDIITVMYRTGSGITTSSKKINIQIAKDVIKCYEKEIKPYNRIAINIGYKRMKYEYLKQTELSNYNILNKIIFLVQNLDVILFKYIKDILR